MCSDQRGSGILNTTRRCGSGPYATASVAERGFNSGSARNGLRLYFALEQALKSEQAALNLQRQLAQLLQEGSLLITKLDLARR